MGRVAIPIGTVFGHLTVLEELPTVNRRRYLLCTCGLCKGIPSKYRIDQLRGEKATMCFNCSRNNTKHGGAENGNRDKDYNRWLSIKQRTTNEEHRAFKDYGARGIRLHKVWFDNPALFMAYIKSLPNRTKLSTLDRVDNNSNYEPMNLRWADRSTQNLNRRKRNE